MKIDSPKIMDKEVLNMSMLIPRLHISNTEYREFQNFVLGESG